MDLIEVLNSNGTGLLEGLCRPGGGYGSFDEYLSNDEDKDDEIEAAFSLNEKKLGTFKIKINRFDPRAKDGIIKAQICDPNNENKTICWIRIIWSDDEFFARFQAFLHDSPIIPLEILKDPAKFLKNLKDLES